MPPDITPGGGATHKDAIRIPDRETNLANFTRVVGLVEMESTRLKNRPDSSLRISTEPGTYWTIQAQRGLLSGLDPNTPSFSATLSPRSKDGLPPFESIQAHAITMFGKTGIVGIHMYPRSGERSWDENTDIGKFARLVDEYSAQAQQATEKAVKDAADLARVELHGMTGIHNDRWAIEVKPDLDYITIWETKDRATERLIIASPATDELPDGTPACPARITVQDLRRGTIINEGRAPIRDLRRAMRLIFPDRAPENTPS